MNTTVESVIETTSSAPLPPGNDLDETGKIPVQAGIPIPPPVRRFGHKNQTKFPFLTMNVGDSFWHTHNCSGAIHKVQKKDGTLRFCTRREFRDGVKGFRIWRTA